MERQEQVKSRKLKKERMKQNTSFISIFIIRLVLQEARIYAVCIQVHMQNAIFFF
jgi:hypothetical protein